MGMIGFLGLLRGENDARWILLVDEGCTNKEFPYSRLSVFGGIGVW